MAFDETLPERIAFLLEKRNVVFETKKMFGGICFMVNEKMCIGSQKGSLMVRFNPLDNEKVMNMGGVCEMDFTTKVMKGFAFIEPWAIETDDELDAWIVRALEYNPLAKSSKKK